MPFSFGCHSDRVFRPTSLFWSYQPDNTKTLRGNINSMGNGWDRTEIWKSWRAQWTPHGCLFFFSLSHFSCFPLRLSCYLIKGQKYPVYIVHSKIPFSDIVEILAPRRSQEVVENIINLLIGFSCYICLYIVISSTKQEENWFSKKIAMDMENDSLIKCENWIDMLRKTIKTIPLYIHQK